MNLTKQKLGSTFNNPSLHTMCALLREKKTQNKLCLVLVALHKLYTWLLNFKLLRKSEINEMDVTQNQYRFKDKNQNTDEFKLSHI